ILTAGDGILYVVENVWHSWNDAPEDVSPDSDEYWDYSQYEESYRLRVVDGSGAVVNTIDLSTLQENQTEDSYFYVGPLAVDSEGRIYISSDQSVYVLDREGKLLGRVDCDDYVQNLYRLPDGSVACYTYHWDNDGATQMLRAVDPATGTLGEGIAVIDFYNAVPGGGDYDFYYTSGINFYGYKLETGEREKLLNWLSCDVNPDAARAAFVLDDGRVMAVSSTMNYGRAGRTAVLDAGDETAQNELIFLTKTPAAEVARKKTLTLATQSLGYDVRSRIIDFNKSSADCRIEVLDYSEYNTGDDYTAGLTKLRTEILSGNMPDILDLGGLQGGQLANKGYLEDLYPYIDADPELKREDLMQNVLTALEQDGKLYRSVGSFSVLTAMGAPALVGDTPGWTVDEFNAALAELRRQNPEAMAFNKYITRDDFFQICFYLDLDNFVNWSTGETRFDSEGFVKMLEFVNGFPTSFDWENYEYSEEDDDYYRVAHGLQMLAPMSLYGFDSVYDLRIYNSLFGGEGTFIGFPTEYGVGSVFQTSGDGFAISSRCSDKDAAWQFLRSFFLDTGDSYAFPIRRSDLEAQMKQAMEPQYQTDENGNYVLDKDGKRQEIEYGSWGGPGYEVPGGPLTEAEARQIMALIESCTKAMNMDQTMFDIVKEGAAPYFEGQRSAEDVAKQIQSKAMIYVNEQR
ncbi:MAG: extracellular solute-binding protein, partial [Oscillospiraceae bacterium]|nr:extracellular solute-binding protein [Oscillospiraceae bacterium]